MTAWYAIAAGSLVLAAVAGWLLPALAVRALLPALEASGRGVANYRGRTVVPGLGVAWVVWAASVALGSALWNAASVSSGAQAGSFALSPWVLATARVPVALVLAAFAFGLVDDAFGDPAAKGFRGHLSALGAGRLTTGALKLFGIGFVALAYGFPAASGSPGSAGWFAGWLATAAVIALSANLVNLTDLRPGRALKAYGALAVLGVAALAASAGANIASAASLTLASDAVPVAGVAWCTVLTIALLMLGPAAAVWRYDLGERGMLGDAGANAMGALAGVLLARSLTLPWLAVAALVLLALNLVSERVSFSKVIEGNAALRWLDGLGRAGGSGNDQDVAVPARGAGVDGSWDDTAGKDGGTSHR